MSTGKPRCTATTMAVQHRQDEPHPMPPQVKMRELQHCIRNLPFYGRGLSVRIGTCKESCQAAKGAENNASFQIGDWASGVQSWHRESYKKRRPGIWTRDGMLRCFYEVLFQYSISVSQVVECSFVITPEQLLHFEISPLWRPHPLISLFALEIRAHISLLANENSAVVASFRTISTDFCKSSPAPYPLALLKNPPSPALPRSITSSHPLLLDLN
ncbi:hypothetical protein HDK90DRAFT_128374 [Phyllosticta capitalensis]|uniref:Uncharacterized protein n=1 Tax=Phyllosticta capitalensis TaxID=121624 RepID=A0ABR1YY26_9PEZI